MTTPVPELEQDAISSPFPPREALSLARPWTWLVPLLYAAYSVADLIFGPWLGLSLGRRILFEMLDLLAFSALALAGLALVSFGRRRLWVFATVLAVVGNPFVPHPFTSVIGDLLDGRYLGVPWVGTPLEVALLLAPGLALLRRLSEPLTSPRLTRDHLFGFTVAGLVVALFVASEAARAPAIWWVGLDRYLLLGLLGAGVGTARGWWPWLHLVLGLTVGLALDVLLNSFTIESAPFLTLALTPLVAGAARALGAVLRAAQRRPLPVLVALNFFNLADALATSAWTRAGEAEEANPFVEAIGLPAKLVLVAAAGWALYRLRPRTLVWPTAALGFVLLWHLLGLLVQA